MASRVARASEQLSLALRLVGNKQRSQSDREIPPVHSRMLSHHPDPASSPADNARLMADVERNVRDQMEIEWSVRLAEIERKTEERVESRLADQLAKVEKDIKERVELEWSRQLDSVERQLKCSLDMERSLKVQLEQVKCESTDPSSLLKILWHTIYAVMAFALHLIKSHILLSCR